MDEHVLTNSSRTMFREELHLILSERMHDIVANTVSETLTTVFGYSLRLSNKYGSVTTS
jgi:hypothetical protein